MTIEPRNRHLLLEPVESKEQNEITILTPEDYHTPKEQYKTYKILSVAEDCSKINANDVGKIVLVNNSAVEEINFGGITQYLMLENHVYGVCTG